MFRLGRRSVALLLAFLGLAGCGGDDEAAANRPQPVPAGGTVLYNKQPVEGATVVFVPDGEKPAATAQTDANGKFQLRTYAPNDGAVPGDYKVTVRKVEVAGSSEQESSVTATSAPKERFLVPERYGNPASTDLTAGVKEGADNNFTLELHD